MVYFPFRLICRLRIRRQTLYVKEILASVIAEDVTHNSEEERYYCMGCVGEGILTVRFTYRGNVIRIYGAGYWRKGRKVYEDQNKIR